MEHTFTQFMRNVGAALFPVCRRRINIFRSNFNSTKG